MAIVVSDDISSKQLLFENLDNLKIYKNLINKFSEIFSVNGYDNNYRFNIKMFFNYKLNIIQFNGKLGETFYIDDFNLNMYLKNKKLESIYIKNSQTLFEEPEFAEFIKEKVSKKAKRVVSTLIDPEYAPYKLKAGYKSIDEFTNDEFNQTLREMLSDVVPIIMESLKAPGIDNIKKLFTESEKIPDEFNDAIENYLNNLNLSDPEQLNIYECKLKVNLLSIEGVLDMISTLFDKALLSIDNNRYNNVTLNIYSLEDRIFNDSDLVKIEDLLSIYVEKNPKLRSIILSSNLTYILNDLSSIIPKGSYIDNRLLGCMSDNSLNKLTDVNICISTLLEMHSQNQNYNIAFKTKLYYLLEGLNSNNNTVFLQENKLSNVINFVKLYESTRIINEVDLSFIKSVETFDSLTILDY